MLHSFTQALRLFPRKDKCLPDALALRAYLGLQGIRTTLVFGIQPSPFMAHCWIQHHDTVLGQDLEAVADFRAIKVVPRIPHTASTYGGERKVLRKLKFQITDRRASN